MLHPKLPLFRSIMPLWYNITKFKCHNYIDIIVSYILTQWRNIMTLYRHISTSL